MEGGSGYVVMLTLPMIGSPDVLVMNTLSCNPTSYGGYCPWGCLTLIPGSCEEEEGEEEEEEEGEEFFPIN